MLRVEFEFVTRRFHGTPWGRHVNEGVVEWPPSPWRIVRALLATGFNKLGWIDVPDSARAVMCRLCSHPPEYWLPPATSAHTRHYMPVFKGSPDKVIDTFVYVGSSRGAVLGVEWPVELTEDEARTLDALLRRMTYLGRAESWVNAQRVARMRDGLQQCVQAEDPPAPGHERVALLAPVSEEHYASWRADVFRREQDARLTAEQSSAVRSNKSLPKKLGKKHLLRLEALFPPTLIDALRVDTATLQRDGWSQPPGARVVSYWRSKNALRLTVGRNRAERGSERVDTALLALASDTARGEVLPPLTDTLRRAEMLHRALVGVASKQAIGGTPVLTGMSADGHPLLGHVHAHLIPLSLDANGHDRPRIDHFLVHAPMGFDVAALVALQRVRETYAKGMPTFYVTLVGTGLIRDFEPAVPLVRPAKCWISKTPFVPPRYLKPRGANALEGQVRAELESRRLPAPISIEVEIERGSAREFVALSEFWSLWKARAPAVRLGASTDATALVQKLSTRWRHFRRERLKEGRTPPIAAGFGLRIAFETHVPGPLALGYGSHFGLGLFEPEPDIR